MIYPELLSFDLAYLKVILDILFNTIDKPVLCKSSFFVIHIGLSLQFLRF